MMVVASMTTSRLSTTTSSTTSIRQALPDSGDGGARMAVRLRLALVVVVVARWSNDLFVIYITFETLPKKVACKTFGLCENTDKLMCTACLQWRLQCASV
jgi:hypothetical protein